MKKGDFVVFSKNHIGIILKKRNKHHRYDILCLTDNKIYSISFDKVSSLMEKQ